MLGNILNRSITHRISCSNASIGSFCSRKRTENDTLYESESQRGESKTGDQKLLWKLMQPYTFDGVLISSGRLSYTLNWFTFQSMHLPHTKTPEARTFSAVYSCPCSGEEDSRFLHRGITSSVMSMCIRSFFIFLPLSEKFAILSYISVAVLLILRWLKEQVMYD